MVCRSRDVQITHFTGPMYVITQQHYQLVSNAIIHDETTTVQDPRLRSRVFLTCCKAWLLKRVSFLMQGSPLAHLRTVFLSIIKACTSQLGQQSPSQTLASQPPLMRPLHTLITACLEIPTAALSATSLDVALYETLADALAPACGRTPAEGEQQRAGDGSIPIRPVAVPSRDDEQLQRQLLHLVLGTYVRRYLCRQAAWHLQMHLQTDANEMHVTTC